MIWIGLVLKPLLAGLKKIPWQVYACAGVLFGCWLYGNYRAGLVQAEWDASIARGTKIVKELKEGQNKVTVRIQEKIVTETKTVYLKGEVREKEIPVFIPSYNDLLPGGFRLWHDAAALDTLPDRSGLTLAAPTSVGDVASTVNKNYTKCHAIRKVALGWQEWYQEQRHLSELAQCKQRGDCDSKGILEQ